MSPRIQKVTMDVSLEPELYSDDPASQQLLIEAYTPRSKPPPSFNDSVVRSAHLLNAARADKLTATAPPATRLNDLRKPNITNRAGGSTAPRTTAKLNKLKRPTDLAADLGIRKQPGVAKRRDIYAIPDSPIKQDDGEDILPQVVNRKPLKVTKRKKAKSPELSVELFTLGVEVPGLSALEVAIPELTPGLAAPELVSGAHLPGEQQDGTRMTPESSILEPSSAPPVISTETHASTTIELLLPNGQQRCTGINISDKSENNGKQCLHKGTTNTDNGWRCAHHDHQHNGLHLDSTMETLNPRVNKVGAANLLSSSPKGSSESAVPARMPKSSPPNPSSAPIRPTVLETHLSSGRFRCQGLHSSQSAISRGTLGQQCSKIATVETNNGWRCQSHDKPYLEGDDRRRSGRATGEREDVAEVNKTKELKDQRQTASIKSAKRKAEPTQPEARKAPKSPRTRKAKPNIVQEVDIPTNSIQDTPRVRRSDPVVMIPVRKSSNLANSAQGGKTTKGAEPGAEDEGTLVPEDEEEASSTTGHQEELPTEEIAQEPAKKATKKHRKKRHASPPHSTRVNLQTKRTSSVPQNSSALQAEVETRHENAEEEDHMTGEGSNAEEDAPSGAEVEAEEVDEDEEKEDASQPTELDRVFKFLDCSERDGDCQTTEGGEINEACHSACTLIVDNEMLLQDISNMVNNIRQKLRNARSITGEKREAFKVDAYGYLFRSLIVFLEAVHDWAVHNADTVGHLSALRLVSPLVQAIISFKDTLASWSPFHRKYREDRNIKQVEQKLIVPLRKIGEAYRAELKQLEHIEKDRRKREELLALRQEREEEEERKAEARRLYKEKARIWQYLETTRLMCEPDPSKRRLLVPPKRANIGERDANGVEFDRVPLFLPRETPPPLAPTIKLKAWTEEESTVLAEALQRFAGPSPHTVFEKIFQHCCKPGGPLRHFNVTDIVTWAAHRRAEYIKLYQLHEWEVEKWIKQIPVLL